MNRSTTAALVVAAIVGAVGGGVSAVVRGDGGGQAPPAVQGASPSADPAGEPGRLLYADARKIHDARTEVPYRTEKSVPDRLVRASSGWVLQHDHEDEQAGPAGRNAVYVVDRNGQGTKIADIRGAFDLDVEGKRIVATDAENDAVTVWRLDGTVEATWREQSGVTHPVWAGRQVVASAVKSDSPAGGEAGAWYLWRWDPAHGTSRQLDASGLAEMAAGRDGRLLSGSVGTEGSSVIEENHCLGVITTPGVSPADHWFTCDWRLNGGASEGFSPAGERILAVPAQTDGFGPGMFATFSATAGPSEGLRKFETPEWTLDAAWLDEETLALTGATDGELDDDTGSWIRLCTLDGDCTREEVRSPGRVVLGEQG